MTVPHRGTWRWIWLGLPTNQDCKWHKRTPCLLISSTVLQKTSEFCATVTTASQPSTMACYPAYPATFEICACKQSSVQPAKSENDPAWLSPSSQVMTPVRSSSPMPQNAVTAGGMLWKMDVEAHKATMPDTTHQNIQRFFESYFQRFWAKRVFVFCTNFFNDISSKFGWRAGNNSEQVQRVCAIEVSNIWNHAKVVAKHDKEKDLLVIRDRAHFIQLLLCNLPQDTAERESDTYSILQWLHHAIEKHQRMENGLRCIWRCSRLWGQQLESYEWRQQEGH